MSSIRSSAGQDIGLRCPPMQGAETVEIRGGSARVSCSVWCERRWGSARWFRWNGCVAAVQVRMTWQNPAHVVLDEVGGLAFPDLPRAPGIYQLTLSQPAG